MDIRFNHFRGDFAYQSLRRYGDEVARHDLGDRKFGKFLQCECSHAEALPSLLFRIEVAGIKGSLTEANATLHYQFANNLGIGTGLKFYRFRLEDTDFSDRDSRYDYDFFGPVIYGSVSF